MGDRKASRIDLIFDLLVEEIEERLKFRSTREARAAMEAPQPPSAVVRSESAPPVAVAPPHDEETASPQTDDQTFSLPRPVHADRLMARLALGMLVAVVLINVPLNRYGTTLATAMPESRSLAIRNGLVVKEEDDPEVYVYQDGKFRWISSLAAFEHYGYTWSDVHIVPDGWLDAFEIGRPIHVLLKCYESPHIYQLEGDTKRWIVDIDAFVAEGHVWEDVRFVSCEYLRSLPDGETIPPGHGPAPQP